MRTTDKANAAPAALEASNLFKRKFGHTPTHVALAPGRLELLGNHTDYNQGLVMSVAVDKYIAEEGEVIPLFQFVQPIIHRKGLKVVAQANGMVLPQLVTEA